MSFSNSILNDRNFLSKVQMWSFSAAATTAFVGGFFMGWLFTEWFLHCPPGINGIITYWSIVGGIIIGASLVGILATVKKNSLG